MGSIVSGALNYSAQTEANDLNYRSQYNTNQTNKQIAQDTNNMNYRIAQETNQANRDLAAQQNQWNIDQWNRENEYNSPVNQMKRLREAGLSPSAAAQMLNGGNAASVSSANLATDQTGAPMEPFAGTAPQVSAPMFDPLVFGSITKTIRDVIQMRKDKADADKAEAEASFAPDLLLTEKDAKLADIDLKRQQYAQMAKAFPYTLRSLRYKAKADKMLPELNKVDFALKRANRQEVEENVKLARQSFNFLEKIKPLEIKKMSEEIKNLLQVRENLIKTGKNIDVNTQKTTAEIGKTEEETKNLKKQGAILTEQGFQSEIQTILAKAGFPEEQGGKIAALVASGKIPPTDVGKLVRNLRDYVIQGYEWLGDDAITRDFFYYYWDKGSANKRGHGMFNRGVYDDFTESLRKAFGKPFSNFDY